MTCDIHGTIRNAAGKCFWCDRVDELRRLNESMARYDAADPEEIDSEEYERVLHRIVAVRKELEQAPASAPAGGGEEGVSRG